jgi:hypothetical protein
MLQMFYLSVRHALLHPGFNPSLKYTPPTTLDNYLNMPLRKMDAIISIINHHLTKDDSRPLVVECKRASRDDGDYDMNDGDGGDNNGEGDDDECEPVVDFVEDRTIEDRGVKRIRLSRIHTSRPTSHSSRV